MGKRTRQLIIAIGIAAILAGVFGWFRGMNTMEWAGGILIGIVLIGSAILDKNQKKKLDSN